MDKIADLERLQSLRERNALTEDEFQEQKRLILGLPPDTGDKTKSDSARNFQTGEFVSVPDEQVEYDEWVESERPNYIRNLILVAFLFIAAIGLYLVFNFINEGDKIRVVLTGDANARDIPSTEGSTVIERLEEGHVLTGAWVEGAKDPSSMWFKADFKGNDVYIWSGNIREIEPEVEDQTSNGPEITQNLPENAPDISVDQEMHIDPIFGFPFETYSLTNLGKTEVINYININGRSNDSCTIWPIFGYDNWEYREDPESENRYVLDDDAEIGFLFFGNPKDNLVAGGIQTMPGEYQATLQVGDEVRLKLPKGCGKLVMLNVSTEYGTYSLRLR